MKSCRAGAVVLAPPLHSRSVSESPRYDARRPRAAPAPRVVVVVVVVVGGGGVIVVWLRVLRPERGRTRTVARASATGTAPHTHGRYTPGATQNGARLIAWMVSRMLRRRSAVDTSSV